MYHPGMKKFLDRRAGKKLNAIIEDLGEHATKINFTILAAKESGNYDQVWPILVNTMFFVPVLVEDENAATTSDYRFAITGAISDEAEGSLMIAENPQHIIAGDEPFNAIRMRASTLIKELNPAVELAIGLPPGYDVFMIPTGQLQWLRDSMQPAG